MVYLEPAEYAEFGLSAETADAWVVAASAMIDAHCRRSTLGSASYTERLRLGARQTAFLSYGPVVSVDAVRGRYGRHELRCGEGYGEGGYSAMSLGVLVMGTFGLAGQWVALDATTVTFDVGSGEVELPWNVLSMPFREAEFTYTAGLAVIPDAVKVACAQIVKNAQATPGLNVRSSRMDALQTQYFSDSLLDVQVQAMLRPYLAERLG